MSRLDIDITQPIVTKALKLNSLGEVHGDEIAKNSNGQGDKPSTA